jgi:hypothetical protein
MIHLMELPNPDHGGRDRHTCMAIRDVSKLKAIFDDAGMDSLHVSTNYGTYFQIEGEMGELVQFNEFSQPLESQGVAFVVYG